jgi:HD-like signal output (HDOD) protein
VAEEPTIPETSAEEKLAAQHAAVFVALSKLPPFHPTALRLMNISVEGDSAMADFEDAFKSDPALTADLLLVANSTEFGLRSRIETIRHALSFLGLERVRSLGCTIAFSFYVRNVPRSPYMRTAWTHSLATAVIAEEIGAIHGVPSLYTAGLVHDLGRLALFLSVGAGYAESLGALFEDMAQSLAVEKEHFGVTHCEAGAMICEKWRFPPSLKTCMTLHHEPVTGGMKDPQNLVRVACAMADILGFPEIRAKNPAPAGTLPDTLRLRPELLPERLRQQINKQLASVGTV